MDNIKYGWVCPLCNTVHAPSVEHCDCNKKVFPSFPSSPTIPDTYPWTPIYPPINPLNPVWVSSKSRYFLDNGDGIFMQID